MGKNLDKLFEYNHFVGSISNIDYHYATVVSNDYYAKEANGIPEKCFLIARSPGDDEIILLSVQKVAELDANRDLRSLKEALSQEVVEMDEENSKKKNLDRWTKNKLQLIGYDCKIVGTFYENENTGALDFGSDVDRIFSATRYKVYKPYGSSLGEIASYCRGTSLIETEQKMMDIGVVRYTETMKHIDPEAKVFADVRDFIGKKSAILGISRSGKSNTIKILAQNVFEYSQNSKQKIGQIIFDPQGEYANTNVQDKGSLAQLGNGNNVVIYRTVLKHDAFEKPLLLNFLERENTQLCWELMLIELRNSMSGGANYISGLNNLDFEEPDASIYPDKLDLHKAKIHYNRKLLGLYAFMKFARYTGFIQGLEIEIGKDNIQAVMDLNKEKELDPNKDGIFYSAISDKQNRGKVQVKSIEAAYVLFNWILSVEEGAETPESDEYLGEILDKALAPEQLWEDNLNTDSNKNKPKEKIQVLSDSWLKDLQDGDLSEFKKQFEAYHKGRTGVVSAFNRIKELHSENGAKDVRQEVWKDLEKGHLVIVDLSKGSSNAIVALSELIVNSLVSHANENFTAGLKPVPFQIIVEEAHNLFSRNGAKDDSVDPWVRLSKEAAKYNIGLVYATQEITSVDPRILSNTSNFIISNSNSRKEMKELSNYYSFGDWTEQIINSESRGFVRVKTESSPFIVPVQVKKFEPNKDEDDF